MRAFMGKKMRLLVAALVLLSVGCGDAQRNDQGVSLLLAGWYNIDDGAPDTLAEATGVSGIYMPLSDANPEERYSDSPAGDGNLIPAVGLQNNLASEFVRVDRAFHSYFIPGASIQPPDTTVGVSVTVGPSRANEEDVIGGGGTLPDSVNEESLGNVAFSEIAIVPPPVRTFLNLNRAYLPEPPFSMVVTTFVEGVTSSGKRITTNSIDLDVWVLNDIQIPSTPGEDGGFGGGEGAAAEEEGEEELE